MKRFLVAGATLAALFVSPTLAADMAARPYTKAPMMMEPAYNWSGFYVGLNTGYTFGDRDRIETTGQAAINVTNVSGGARPASVRSEREGFIGGGQIGYNWQTSPNWVFGVEADIQYVDVRRTTDVTTIPLSGIGTLNNSFRTNLDYLGTVRGRLGYTWGETMLYATGGFAYGGVDNSAAFFGTPATGGLLQFSGRDRRTRTGYTLGGGIEHMFAPNWGVKAEYLYYDLDNSNLNVAVIPGSGGGGTGYNSRIQNDGHIVRAGLNYKWGGPVVARY